MGTPGTGRSFATILRENSVHVRETVSEERDPFGPEPFSITRMPVIPEPWVDPKEPVYNHRKHLQTCAKNRKKRRK